MLDWTRFRTSCNPQGHTETYHYAYTYFGNLMAVDDFRPTGMYKAEKIKNRYHLFHTAIGFDSTPGVIAYDRTKDRTRLVSVTGTLRAAKEEAGRDFVKMRQAAAVARVAR